MTVNISKFLLEGYKRLLWGATIEFPNELVSFQQIITIERYLFQKIKNKICNEEKWVELLLSHCSKVSTQIALIKFCSF